MRRLLLSVSGGVIISFSLIVLRPRLPGDYLRGALREFLFWPLFAWKNHYTPGCEFCLPFWGVVWSFVYVGLLFSLLTYAFLWLRGRRRPR